MGALHLPNHPAMSSTLAAVGDTVTDVSAKVADVVTDAADAVTDVVGDVVGRAHGVARPAKSRRWNPWVFVALAVVAMAGTGWWLRRRRHTGRPTEGADVTADGASPMSEYRAAAGS